MRFEKEVSSCRLNSLSLLKVLRASSTACAAA